MVWKKHTPLYEKALKKTKNAPMETTWLGMLVKPIILFLLKTEFVILVEMGLQIRICKQVTLKRREQKSGADSVHHSVQEKTGL